MMSLNELSTYLGEKLSGRIGDAVFAYGELTISVEPHDLIEVVTFLRDDKNCQFISIIDVCGADYPSRAKRRPWCRRSPASIPAPTGSNARPTISMACCSRAIPICAGS
jgi:NADH:ubiquinone oxidoreductase subunit C